MIVVHRLAKVANNPVLKCPIPDDVIGVCGNENCRDRVPRHDQLPVQLDPVIPGMWTSVTKQAVWAREGDTRKSAADGKASQQSSAGAPKQWLMCSAIRLGNGPLHVDTDWG